GIVRDGETRLRPQKGELEMGPVEVVVGHADEEPGFGSSRQAEAGDPKDAAGRRITDLHFDPVARILHDDRISVAIVLAFEAWGASHPGACRAPSRRQARSPWGRVPRILPLALD